ncbi:MAG: tRNA (guanosine(46)-N7)-methyltransferase TrmB [Tannerella sp.]|jgi:tRNA (guanine-N7-)-methyltransferase|nr:tRNA (guanosine(46)-N7)-methyltransferase TrmB [Tannerella sp.]
MSKNKLKKFDEMAGFPNVFQYPFARLTEGGGCPLRGRWGAEVFANDNPIALELGCGRGEYTVGMGRLFPDKNFIGIDIKGARMWTGAKEALKSGMKNVAFLRTDIELIDRFFAPGEVSEIWLTFPDPQMKKVNKRLTGTRFVRLYSAILAYKGLINLKTDSDFLFTYTREMIRMNGFAVHTSTDDLYMSGLADEILSIRTNYEQQWLDRGIKIKFLRFAIEPRTSLVEPDIEIPPDPYRSYKRVARGNNLTHKTQN